MATGRSLYEPPVRTGCAHRFLLAKTCVHCRRFLEERRRYRQALADEQRAEQGAPSIRELQTTNQERLRNERELLTQLESMSEPWTPTPTDAQARARRFNPFTDEPETAA